MTIHIEVTFTVTDTEDKLHTTLSINHGFDVNNLCSAAATFGDMTKSKAVKFWNSVVLMGMFDKF
jgi:hypothetical protein